MIAPRNPFNDRETTRQLRNNTNTQKKNLIDTKQGVIINTFPHEGDSATVKELKSDYVIPENAALPKDLFVSTNPESEKGTKKSVLKNPLFLLSAATLILTGGMAAATAITRGVAKSKLKIPKLEGLEDIKILTENTKFKNQYKDFITKKASKDLPDLGRNMNLNKEEFFVTYMLVRNPDVKTTMATAAFFAFSVAGFVLKNFVDGAKSIWVKKQESHCDKDLQESLIDVETRVFKGKNEIIRNLLSSTASELQDIEKSKKQTKRQQTFSSFLGTPSFGQTQTFDSQKNKILKPQQEEHPQKKEKKWLYPVLAAATIGGGVLFSVLSYKNIKKVNEMLTQAHNKLLTDCGEIMDKASSEELSKYKDNVVDLLSSFNFRHQDAKKVMEKAKCDDDTIKNVTELLKQKNNKNILSDACTEMGGYAGKIQFYAYNDDPKGHFYNWMMNLGSRPLGQLSILLSAISGFGYIGQKAVEGVKEAEVKKANTETELNLQKSLINTELKNFYSKKQSYIEPLMSEIRAKYPELSDEDLKKKADNILFEIKNGPPFVYS